MKKILVVSAIAELGLTSVAFAGGLPEEMPAAPAAAVSSDTGIYLGLEGGYGITNWKNLGDMNGFELYPAGIALLQTSNVTNNNGFVGRVFAGYQINKYFAVEGGYSYFFNKAKSSYNWVYANTSTIVAGTVTDEVKTQAFDLLLKVIAPVVDSFDLYAKVGPSYMMSKHTVTSNTNNFGVTFGAGADYAITPNVIANVEWLRNSGSSKWDNKYQPNTDAFMLGLRYKFDL